MSAVIVSKKTNYPIEQVVILAGGKGTRLGKLTQSKPKPLMPIRDDGASFLELCVSEYARQGFSDILIVAGYLGDQISAVLDGRRFGRARVRVLTEREPLGTGGALLAANQLLHERFIVANGDSFIDANIRAFAATELATGSAAMLVRQVDDASRYGTVELDGDVIRKFIEKSSVQTSGYVNAGVYVFDRSILRLVSSTPFSLETELFPQLALGGKLKAFVASGFFIDIGLPEFLERARVEIPTVLRRPAVFFDRDGVLNHDDGHVGFVSEFRWIDGAFQFVRAVNDARLRAVVITNQGGVARAKYGVDDVDTLHDWMNRTFAEHGGFIDRFYFCPYHEDAVLAAYRGPHIERKPNPGMILRAAHELNIDLTRSIVIGDKISDMQAAASAGVHGILAENGDLLNAVRQARSWFNRVGIDLRDPE